MSHPNRIFLSHKSTDKVRVREYKLTLETLGLNPWIDEDDLPAGAELERALLAGVKDSCASIFFVTPNYIDEKYLRAEINYAVAEKRQGGDDFAIITLVLGRRKKDDWTIPDLLKPYVWKEPKTDLEGIREILKALPAHLGRPRLIPTEGLRPDVRVMVTWMKAIPSDARGPTMPTDMLSIKAENHDKRSVYLSSGLCIDYDDGRDTNMWIGEDVWKLPLRKRVIEPGDAYTVPISFDTIIPHLDGVNSFFFVDELRREFHSSIEETKALANRIIASHAEVDSAG